MRSRTTIVLAVLAAVLVVIAIISRRAERSSERLASGPIFPTASWETVSEIRLTAETDTVLLHRPDGHWRVASEGDYPADTAAVRRIFEQLEHFDRRTLRSTSPEMQATFEVDDSSGTEVYLGNAQGDAVAHFRLGKNGPDYRSQYIRPVGSHEVFLIPEYLRGSLDATRPTWRDRTILAFDRATVKQVRFTPPEGEPALIEKDAQGTFMMTLPDSAEIKANLFDASLRGLSSLSCETFPDSLFDPNVIGLSPPTARVEILMEDGARFGLDFGDETEDGRHVYVRRDGAETIFLIGKGRMTTLVRDAAGLRAPLPEETETVEE